jgi:hypothetical protein
LLSYFEPRPVDTPFKCNFCRGALFCDVLDHVSVRVPVACWSLSRRQSGDGLMTMVHGTCESRIPWYNPASASSLFPSMLPPLPSRAGRSIVQHVHVREDRDFFFDGGASACAIMNVVCASPTSCPFPNRRNSSSCFCFVSRFDVPQSFAEFFCTHIRILLRTVRN